MSLTQSLDILMIADPKEVFYVKNYCDCFSATYQFISNLEEVIDSKLEPKVLVVSEFGEATEELVEEQIQISRQQFPNAYLILIVKKELTKERFNFLSKLGARTVLLKSEISTVKLEFAIHQILKTTYLPIKTESLLADYPMQFSIYHMLPFRRKFLLISKKGDALSGHRLSRYQDFNELYIHRFEAINFMNYINEVSEKISKGIVHRCRANFLALQSEYLSMVLELTDQSNRVSFGEGQELLNRCEKLCLDLIENLTLYPRVWEVINNSAEGGLGDLDRAPSIAAYCAVFSSVLGLSLTKDTMLASLIIDIGLTRLQSTLAQSSREGKNLSPDELKLIQSVPQMSLDSALSRKLSIPENLRRIVCDVYERADGKGYPRGINNEKMTKESQIIRLAKEFDLRTRLKLGSLQKTPKEALLEILSSPDLEGVFTFDLRLDIQKKLLTNDIFKDERG